MRFGHTHLDRAFGCLRSRDGDGVEDQLLVIAWQVAKAVLKHRRHVRFQYLHFLLGPFRWKYSCGRHVAERTIACNNAQADEHIDLARIVVLQHLHCRFGAGCVFVGFLALCVR